MVTQKAKPDKTAAAKRPTKLNLPKIKIQDGLFKGLHPNEVAKKVSDVNFDDEAGPNNPKFEPIPALADTNGDEITPLKEADGGVGVELHAGPSGTNKINAENANILRLGGKKYPGRILVGSAGANLNPVGRKGARVEIDGAQTRVSIASDKKPTAYFGLSPAFSWANTDLAPALVFLNDKGQLLSIYSGWAAVTPLLYAGSLQVGHSGIAGSPAIDGSLSVVSKDSSRSVVISGATGDILLGNADCAEDFDLEDGVDGSPGTVSIITAEGRLIPCHEEFDTRVVGIVSGARNYKPALILDRQPAVKGNTSKTYRRVPVALMGKVFCKVDARTTPVSPGDLLTTSSLPGHAMALKKNTKGKATGAILGKALGTLTEGVGLVPILVLRA